MKLFSFNARGVGIVRSGALLGRVVPAINRGGGLLCLWNPSLFALDECVVGAGFLGLIVRSEDERRGVAGVSSTQRREMQEFNLFIADLELLDLPLAGRRFTWRRPNNSARSRIDRFLVTNDWCLTWPHCSQLALNRDVSDHCPILLRQFFQDWGPKPFKVLNCWLSDARLPAVVEKAWAESRFHGWGAFVLKEKLKYLRGKLKIWNKEVFGDLKSRREDAVRKINQLDLKEEEKSRSKWIAESDQNTKFFHSTINWKRRSNSIVGLLIDGVWEEEPSRDNADLVAPFDKEEVRSAVWECGGDKSPGPDGFNFKFIHKFWQVVEGDFCKVVNEFWRCGAWPTGSNASFIVLITKFAFIGGRNMLDSVVVVNEVVHEAKSKKRPTIIFKVDYEKAYDSVLWDFLEYMMRRMRFSEKWISWILSCIGSASVSVLVSGSPSAEFRMEKGLRQGDPLAPFLFLIVVEG
ncbi:uncharacterized protein LOC130743952 [Lotus japonicus]|uniref:uncharacterized protein LOC130743952 n=1 Tax=Lotus japonicus TaxID=34305 RepID=UPI0025878C6A|nr:uncharacterized protein LOC130743952 [Lotus japonicus]